MSQTAPPKPTRKGIPRLMKNPEVPKPADPAADEDEDHFVDARESKILNEKPPSPSIDPVLKSKKITRRSYLHKPTIASQLKSNGNGKGLFVQYQTDKTGDKTKLQKTVIKQNQDATVKHVLKTPVGYKRRRLGSDTHTKQATNPKRNMDSNQTTASKNDFILDPKIAVKNLVITCSPSKSTVGTVKKFTAVNTAAVQGYTALRKSEAELKKKNIVLEEKVKNLEKELNDVKVMSEGAQKENQELTEQFKQAEVHHKETLQEQKCTLTQENKRLQLKMVLCEKKLEACNINPVSLTSMELNSEQKENTSTKRKLAMEKATLLKQRLEKLTAKGELYLKSMNEITRKCQDVSSG